MAHLLFKQCRGTTRDGPECLVEAGTSRPGAVAADRFDFGRRHPMQADHGGATRVYVHGCVKWRTSADRRSAPFGARIVVPLAGPVNPRGLP